MSVVAHGPLVIALYWWKKCHKSTTEYSLPSCTLRWALWPTGVWLLFFVNGKSVISQQQNIAFLAVHWGERCGPRASCYCSLLMAKCHKSKTEYSLPSCTLRWALWPMGLWLLFFINGKSVISQQQNIAFLAAHWGECCGPQASGYCSLLMEKVS